MKGRHSFFGTLANITVAHIIWYLSWIIFDGCSGLMIILTYLFFVFWIIILSAFGFAVEILCKLN